MYFVYILECTDGTLYTGITNNLAKRLSAHKAGKGGSYTRSRTVKRFVYTEKAKDRSSALKREAAIKKLRRNQKRTLISAQLKNSKESRRRVAAA